MSQNFANKHSPSPQQQINPHIMGSVNYNFDKQIVNVLLMEFSIIDMNLKDNEHLLITIECYSKMYSLLD